MSLKLASFPKPDFFHRRATSLSEMPECRKSRRVCLQPLRRALTEITTSRSGSLSPPRNIYRKPAARERAPVQRARSMNRGERYSQCEDADVDVMNGQNKLNRKFGRKPSSWSEDMPEDWPALLDPSKRPPILKRTPSANSNLGGKKAQFDSKVNVMYYDELEKPRSVLKRIQSHGHLKTECSMGGLTSDEISLSRDNNNLEAKQRLSPDTIETKSILSPENQNKENTPLNDNTKNNVILVTNNDVTITRCRRSGCSTEYGLQLCVRIRMASEYVMGKTVIRALSGGRHLMIIVHKTVDSPLSSPTSTTSPVDSVDKPALVQLTQDVELPCSIDAYNLTSRIDEKRHCIIVQAPVVTR